MLKGRLVSFFLSHIKNFDIVCMSLLQHTEGEVEEEDIRYVFFFYIRDAAISPHRVSLNKLSVDMNNVPFRRPTIIDASSLSVHTARSLATGLPDHHLETTPSAL